jgi:hypothetical protein
MEDMPTTQRLCSIDGCQNPSFTRGWCSKHYSRWQRHGDPLFTARSSPTKPGDTTKRCPRCTKVKPLDEFGLRPNGKPKGYCRKCEAAYQAQHSASEEGREQHRLARGRWNESNYGYFLHYRYGITIDDYLAMVRKQGDRCAICGTTDPGCGNSRWAVDHCHDELKVRGLLCMSCNTGLGYYRDDPELLRAAAAYIEAANL